LNPNTDTKKLSVVVAKFAVRSGIVLRLGRRGWLLVVEKNA